MYAIRAASGGETIGQNLYILSFHQPSYIKHDDSIHSTPARCKSYDKRACSVLFLVLIKRAQYIRIIIIVTTIIIGKMKSWSEKPSERNGKRDKEKGKPQVEQKREHGTTQKMHTLSIVSAAVKSVEGVGER